MNYFQLNIFGIFTYLFEFARRLLQMKSFPLHGLQNNSKKPGVPKNDEFGLPEKRQFFQPIYMFKFVKTKMWVFSNDFFANVSFC